MFRSGLHVAVLSHYLQVNAPSFTLSLFVCYQIAPKMMPRVLEY